jgi:hypothetical protein
VCILTPLYVDENTDANVGIKCPTNQIIKYELAEKYVVKMLIFTPASNALGIRRNREITSTGNYTRTNVPDSRPQIYMDSEPFGSGCSCLQVTQQLQNVEQARYMYDQLAIISPIMLALTAASPIFRGLLADTDVRWPILRDSVDDRPPHERDIISKTRYDTIR